MPDEDTVQPEHLCSLIRIFTVYILNSQRCKIFHVDNEDSDQTMQMCSQDLSLLDVNVRGYIFSLASIYSHINPCHAE